MNTLIRLTDALMFQHNPHERWQGLMDIHGTLDHADFWFLFHRLWVEDSTNLFPHEEKIRRMLSPERLNATERMRILSEIDRQWWRSLLRRTNGRNVKGVEKTIKVYRGAGQVNMAGMVWTTDYDLAHQHAADSGFEKPFVVVGRALARRVITLDEATSSLFILPEMVDRTEIRDVKIDLSETQLYEIRLRQMVRTYGPHHPLQLSHSAYFKNKIEEGTVKAPDLVKTLTDHKKVLEPLGFTSRVKTINETLQVI